MDKPHLQSPSPRRRHLLQGCCAALGAGLFSGLGLSDAAKASEPEEAARLRAPWLNPCLGPLPESLARHERVQAAFEGLDATRLVDTHAHLLGTGDAGSGCTIHPSLTQWWHPLEVLRRRGILNASCVGPQAPSVDRAYVERLQRLARDFPAGARWWLFAFDSAHSDEGLPDPARTTFHVPDDYARSVAAAQADRFDWVASIHPYRLDALQALQRAVDGGARAVKWLPSAMNIDLRDRRSAAFAEAAASAGLPLIVHSGEELAVPGAGRDAFGNPLHVRHLLERGATVVMAHCGSLGQADDEDRPSRTRVPAFDLFARLMDEGHHGRRLMGDLSALFQRNRRPEVWRAIVRNERWHDRLLHGSDHPLPGVMPLLSLPRLVRSDLLDESAVPLIEQIRQHNPLLADLMVKRELRSGSARLPAGVFEGRALEAARTGRSTTTR